MKIDLDYNMENIVIMDTYENKYKTALERAKKVLLDCTPEEQKVVEYIIPELAESEDEKIRNELLLDIPKVFPYEKAIRYIAWLEKQGEQSPADKVEPKFKVGDLVVQNGLGTYKIVEVCESWYEVIAYNDGIQYYIDFDEENDCHLWSIEDAKDGDVLAGHESFVIFKEIEGFNIKCYCTYHYMGSNPSFYVDTLQNKTAFCPATKEQCDLLFQKMKEAGYEWDAEKKELKKIEQKPVECSEKDITDVFEQVGLAKIVREQSNDNLTNALQDAMIELSKFIPQPKLAWCKEDEIGLGDALWAIEQARTIAKDENDMGNIWYAERWLKNLKDRYTWKPSDEQMNALEHFVRSIGESGYASPYDNTTKLLYSLLFDLKKLREEDV